METISRNVRDIETADRRVLEHVFGTPLDENQRVIINVVNIHVTPAATVSATEAELPEWCDVYAGLSEEEVDLLDQATKRRLDLSRSPE